MVLDSRRRVRRLQIEEMGAGRVSLTLEQTQRLVELSMGTHHPRKEGHVVKQRWHAAPDNRAAAHPLRLNVGCGSTAPPTWINIDNSPTMWLAQRRLPWRLARKLRLVPSDMDDTPNWASRVVIADARRDLPFPAGQVDAIYTSHFLEHLTRDDAVRFLREARRLLKTDGLIRIVVPDLANVVERYHRDRDAGDPRAADRMFDNLWVVDKGLERYPAWFKPLKTFLRTDVHKWLYDEPSLTTLMMEEGFHEVHPCRYLESAIPGIQDVEDPERLQGAVCLEGCSPGPGVRVDRLTITQSEHSR
jgi:predicted SAM-dependent methyltransferase